MSEIKYTLPGPDTITLSGQTVNKLIRSGDGDAALLYLYILKTEGKSTMEETMAALGKGKGWISTAMTTLSRMGLIHLDSKSADASVSGDFHEIPDGPNESTRSSTEDMRRELEAGSDFSIVVEQTQKTLGTILSPEDLLRLFGIYDYLSMPPEVIMHLITYCINESRRTRGGHAPKMTYIEKAAYTWAREGILTLERAEEYIKNLEDKRSLRYDIKSTLQIRDREFSATEKKYVDSWIAMGFEAEAIGIAYDRTIVKTGERTWNYMDKIINSWHRKGLHTAEDINEKDSPNRKVAQFLEEKNRQQKVNAPNQDEINYMQRVLDKTKRS